MSELRPCPFCGYERVAYTAHEIQDKGTFEPAYMHLVWCKKNPHHHAHGGDKEQAVNTWNTRPLEAALQSRIDQLEKALREIVVQARGMDNAYWFYKHAREALENQKGDKND